MGLELTADRYPPITSQTRYPLRHAKTYNKEMVLVLQVLPWCLFFQSEYFNFFLPALYKLKNDYLPSIENIWNTVLLLYLFQSVVKVANDVFNSTLKNTSV